MGRPTSNDGAVHHYVLAKELEVIDKQAELREKRQQLEPLRRKLVDLGIRKAPVNANPGAKQLVDFFNEYAGTGDELPGQFYANQ